MDGPTWDGPLMAISPSISSSRHHIHTPSPQKTNTQGTGEVETELIPFGYKWATAEEYEAGLRAIYEQGDFKPPHTVVLTEAEANAAFEAGRSDVGAAAGAAVVAE